MNQSNISTFRRESDGGRHCRKKRKKPSFFFFFFRRQTAATTKAERERFQREEREQERARARPLSLSLIFSPYLSLSAAERGPCEGPKRNATRGRRSCCCCCCLTKNEREREKRASLSCSRFSAELHRKQNCRSSSAFDIEPLRFVKPIFNQSRTANCNNRSHLSDSAWVLRRTCRNPRSRDAAKIHSTAKKSSWALSSVVVVDAARRSFSLFFCDAAASSS